MRTVKGYAPTVLGDRIRDRDLGWSRVVEAFHRPGMHLTPHAHEHPALTLVREGAFRLNVAGEEYDCDSRGVFFKLGDCNHANRFGPEGARSLVIELHPSYGEPHLERIPLAEHSFLTRAGAAVQLAREIEREFRGFDAASGLALEGLILELLAFLLRTSEQSGSDEPDWMRTALEVLHDGFPSKITLRDVADAAGVHAVHLARVFRKHHGCSVGEFVRRLRIERAAECLRTTDRSLVEIALECGFYDQAHFCRSFKERIGTSPGAYRRSFRPGGR